jgi:hypothetical protein
MKELHAILETLAAKRAARTQIAAPLAAAIKEAQTIHDASVAEADHQISELEAEAVKLAEDHKAELFAKKKSYTHADEVLKLTTSRAVSFTDGRDEEGVLVTLAQEASDGDPAARACLTIKTSLNKKYIASQCTAEHEAWFRERGLIMQESEAITIKPAA